MSFLYRSGQKINRFFWRALWHQKRRATGDDFQNFLGAADVAAAATAAATTTVMRERIVMRRGVVTSAIAVVTSAIAVAAAAMAAIGVGGACLVM